ncbi:uncharacterized protein LOC125547917 isoform X2 [Triticum urartu]|uniref:uncharacterized protein LOC125547917 isoform X2 n=1 Tax=Triticum urartu TaxID=4572 RepID=UPI0020440B0C|nr:uncharacterized protein LOC125547917 isoform X2 [Triticum urartu]
MSKNHSVHHLNMECHLKNGTVSFLGNSIQELEQAPEAGSRARLERVFYSNNAGHEALVKMCADEHMQQWKVLHGGRRVVGYIEFRHVLIDAEIEI